MYLAKRLKEIEKFVDADWLAADDEVFDSLVEIERMIYLLEEKVEAKKNSPKADSDKD